jgi:AAA15 family ATPase/GTPase
MAAIFGPNASGKSNIFNALNTSRKIILKQTDRRYSSYFRLEPEYAMRPTFFEYEIIVKGEPYRYGFEIMLGEEKVTGEWLYRISLEGEDLLLFRAVNGIITDGEISKKEREILNKNIKKYGNIPMLTLSDLFRENNKGYYVIEESIKILDWFQNNLIIIGVSDTLRSHSDYKPEELEELSKIMRAFDVGINNMDFAPWIDDLWMNAAHDYTTREKSGDLTLSGVATEKREGKKKKMLVSRHGNNNIEMLRMDESDGTRRLQDLAPILMKDDLDKTYVVDELDRSLHPVVVYHFVEWFLKKHYSEPKQLITTTHQTLLMDQELLRRDEIWFVEKKNDGHSELFSLEDYNEKIDRKIDKSYFDGRYGAIPKIHLRRE